MRLGRRKKAELHKVLQSEDAGLTATDVTTDEQVQRFTNTIAADRDDKLGKVTN